MSDDPIRPFDVKTIWKGQPQEIRPMAPDIVRRNARRLQRRRLFIVVLETLLGLVSILMFAVYVRILPGMLLKIASGLAIPYMVLYIWNVLVVVRPRRVPDDTAACLEFHRRELERQRDIARNRWRWVIPFIPIFLLICVGRWIGPTAAGRSPWIDHLVIVLAAVAAVEGWVLAWLWNLHRADRWQDQIDELGPPGGDNA